MHNKEAKQQERYDEARVHAGTACTESAVIRAQSKRTSGILMAKKMQIQVREWTYWA